MFHDIKWIFFDMGSTLIDDSEADLRRIREMLAGTDITEEEYNKKRLEMIEQGYRGDRALIESLGLPRIPWSNEGEVPYPDAVPTLEVLKSRGFKLGVVANQTPGSEARLAGWDLLKYFDVVAASAELGVSKPNPAIFLWALERAGCAPENAVMIGDRIDNDIAAPARLGMHTVRILRGFGADHKPQNSDEIPEYNVRALTEIPDLV